MASNGLNTAEKLSTSVDMGGPRRKAPTTTLNGPSLATHLKEALDEIALIESAAYKEMGGTTKVSFSDQLGQAVEMYVRAYIKENGAFQMLSAKDRAEYVKQRAEKNRAELRKQLSQP